jgi:2-phospho-L-lactate guanylyltransferase
MTAEMNPFPPLWAVIPIKETRLAKQRLAGLLSPVERQKFAQAMIEDVLDALADVPELAGVVVVTADPAVIEFARRRGMTVTDRGAYDGHTGAVTVTARELAAKGCAVLTMPADIPLVTARDIRAVIAARKAAPSFTIVPARDFQGSNAVILSPADAVPLRFGDNSFYPHLAAAEAAGITPNVVRCASIELDIDTPEDLDAFQAVPSDTRAAKLVARLLRAHLVQGAS